MTRDFQVDLKFFKCDILKVAIYVTVEVHYLCVGSIIEAAAAPYNPGDLTLHVKSCT